MKLLALFLSTLLFLTVKGGFAPPTPIQFNGPPTDNFMTFGNVGQGSIWAPAEYITGPTPASIIILNTNQTLFYNLTIAYYFCNSTTCLATYPADPTHICYVMPGLNFYSENSFWNASIFLVEHMPGIPSMHGADLDPIDYPTDGKRWNLFHFLGQTDIYTGIALDIGTCCDDIAVTAWVDHETGYIRQILYAQGVPQFITTNGTSTLDGFLSGFIRYTRYTKDVSLSDIPNFNTYCGSIANFCDGYTTKGYCNEDTNCRVPYTVTIT